VHTIYLDPTLLNLKVCSSIFIRLRANPINLKFENAVITDRGQNIIEFIEEIGCKRLMRVANLCRGGVY
jgi:hypothetical protein